MTTEELTDMLRKHSEIEDTVRKLSEKYVLRHSPEDPNYSYGGFKMLNDNKIAIRLISLRRPTRYAIAKIEDLISENK